MTMFSLILSDTYKSDSCYRWTNNGWPDLLDVRDPTDDTVWDWGWTRDQWPGLMVLIDFYLWLQKLDVNRTPGYSSTAAYYHTYEGTNEKLKRTFTFCDVDKVPSKGF